MSGPPGSWELPPGWEWVPLGDLCEIKGGGTPRRSETENFGGGIPWAKISDITAVDGGELTVTEETLSERGLAESSAYLAPIGTVAISMYASMGAVCYLGVEAAFNQAIAGVQVDRSRLLPWLLVHWIAFSRETLASQGRGGTQANLNAQHLREWMIPLPPMEQQERIVRLLREIREAKSLLQNQLQTLDALAESVTARGFQGNLDRVSTDA